MNLPILDTIVLIIIIASAIWGIFKGFVSQIVSILSLIFGVWCAFKFSHYFSGQLKNLFSLPMEQPTLQIIMFIFILIIIIILGHFLAKGLEGIVKLSMLEWLNKLLGFVFAALKAIIILSIIVYVINYLNNCWDFIPKETFATSKTFKFLTAFSSKLFPYLQNLL
ncbi:MAG: CvpA family protein [Bacteroidales bacterium]